MQSKFLLSTPTPAYRQAGSPSPIIEGGVLRRISNIFGRGYLYADASSTFFLFTPLPSNLDQAQN